MTIDIIAESVVFGICIVGAIIGLVAVNRAVILWKLRIKYDKFLNDRRANG